MFNLITHKINNERSDYLYTHFLLETNGSAPFSIYLVIGRLRPSRLTSFILYGVQQLDIVKFALPLVKISFHPIFPARGKHTNFFMSEQAASRPLLTA